MNITIAKKLTYRDTLYHFKAKNADGTALRARVNGRIKLWSTRPNDYRLPMKYGLKKCFYITPTNENEWIKV